MTLRTPQKVKGSVREQFMGSNVTIGEQNILVVEHE